MQTIIMVKKNSINHSEQEPSINSFYINQTDMIWNLRKLVDEDKLLKQETNMKVHA